jgi:hypothetical protein
MILYVPDKRRVKKPIPVTVSTIKGKVVDLFAVGGNMGKLL